MVASTVSGFDDFNVAVVLGLVLAGPLSVGELLRRALVDAARRSAATKSSGASQRSASEPATVSPALRQQSASVTKPIRLLHPALSRNALAQANHLVRVIKSDRA